MFGLVVPCIGVQLNAAISTPRSLIILRCYLETVRLLLVCFMLNGSSLDGLIGLRLRSIKASCECFGNAWRRRAPRPRLVARINEDMPP